MAVTVTYQYPVSGTVPPTAFQVASEVNATVNWLDTDTTATVTHNFALAATDPAALFPVVVITENVNSAGTVAPAVVINKTSTNAVVLTKSSAAGSGGTLDVAVLRPHSMMR